MPKNHNTHSSHEAQPDKLELSNNMSREELLEYYDNQLDRIVLLNEALGYPEDEWTNENGYFESGAALRDLVSTIYDDETYTPVEDDIFVARYVDAAIEEKTAFYSIDGQALLDHYKNNENVTDLDAAVLRYAEDVANDLKGHNVKIANKIKDNVKPDPENPENLLPLDDKDLTQLGNNRRANFRIIGDVEALKHVDEVLEEGMTVKTFIELRNRYAAGEVTEADVNEARKELTNNTVTLGRAADAYLLIVGDKKHNFKMKDFVDWLDLEEDQRRAHTIAEQQSVRENAAKDIDATLVPQNKAQRKAAQARREQADSQSDDATSGDSGTPPPVGGNHNQQSGGQNDPSGAQSHAINQLRQQAYEARVQAAKDQYDLAKYNLASISAKRSEFFGASRVQAQEAITAHQLFDEAIQELAELDPMMRAVMSDPELTLEERGAQINAFYVAKHAELRKATTEEMGNNWSNKGAEFIVRHKRKLKIGAVVLGGLTGGVGGVILGTAISVGAAKAAQHHAKQQKAFAAADNGAAGSLSFVNSAVSLEAVDAEAANHDEHSTDPAVLQRIAQAAAKNLRHQHEKNFVEKYRDVHRKRALGAAAVGAGWFTAIMVGGHMVTGFVDYQLHGSGGMMDKLNHLDNPNGPTPWKPTVGKPWWMW